MSEMVRYVAADIEAVQMRWRLFGNHGEIESVALAQAAIFAMRNVLDKALK